MPDRLVEKQEDGDRMRAILVVAATMGFVSAPFWSAGFGGFNPESFPVPLNDPPTQPAGYVFSIWGLIYLWLLASALYGLLRRAEDDNWDAGRWWVIASLALGTPWISVANVSPVLATILIIGMLATSIRALFLTPTHDRWMLRLPLALYAGWLTAASGVSLSILAIGYGASGAWPILALILAVLVGVAVQLTLARAPTYGAAIAWGLLGVVVKTMSSGGSSLAAIALFSTMIILWAAYRSESQCK